MTEGSEATLSYTSVTAKLEYELSTPVVLAKTLGGKSE